MKHSSKAARPLLIPLIPLRTPTGWFWCSKPWSVPIKENGTGDLLTLKLSCFITYHVPFPSNPPCLRCKQAINKHSLAYQMQKYQGTIVFSDSRWGSQHCCLEVIFIHFLVNFTTPKSWKRKEMYNKAKQRINQSNMLLDKKQDFIKCQCHVMTPSHLAYKTKTDIWMLSVF